MPGIVSTILLLFCLLQIKHMFADFFLQTQKMLAGRGQYLHMGRAQHAAIHSVGSVLVFMVIGADPLFILLLVCAEWVVHFNIDWCKGRICEAQDLNPSKAAFWRITGFDQAMHQLTYVAMVWAWVTWAAP